MAAMQNPGNANPLSNADYQRLQKGLAAVAQAKLMIEQAKQAGIDVSELEARADETRQIGEQMKRVYFPDKP